LKLFDPGNPAAGREVAPFTGAWIETHLIRLAISTSSVAPFTGAWIETAGNGELHH